MSRSADTDYSHIIGRPPLVTGRAIEYDEVEEVPPCKRLRRLEGGSFEVVEVITQRRRISDGYFRTDIQTAPKPPAPVVKLKPPKVKAPSKAKEKRRGGGRGQGWSRIAGLTTEAIIECFREGLSISQIAEKFHCRYNTVNDRLVEARKTSAEFRAADTAAKMCSACGGVKRHAEPICRNCKRATMVCSAEGCQNRAYAKGLCMKHYSAQYKAKRVIL